MCAYMCHQRGPTLLYAALPFAAGSHVMLEGVRACAASKVRWLAIMASTHFFW